MLLAFDSYCKLEYNCFSSLMVISVKHVVSFLYISYSPSKVTTHSKLSTIFRTIGGFGGLQQSWFIPLVQGPQSRCIYSILFRQLNHLYCLIINGSIGLKIACGALPTTQEKKFNRRRPMNKIRINFFVERVALNMSASFQMKQLMKRRSDFLRVVVVVNKNATFKIQKKFFQFLNSII